MPDGDHATTATETDVSARNAASPPDPRAAAEPAGSETDRAAEDRNDPYFGDPTDHSVDV